MPENKPINEQELDELFREFFLDENNLPESQKDANFILTQDYPADIDPAKEQEFLSRLNPKPGSFGNTGLFISITIIAFVAVLSAYLFSVYHDPDNTSVPLQKVIPVSPESTVQNNSENSDLLNPDGSSLTIKTTDTFDRPHNGQPVTGIRDSIPAKPKDATVHKSEKPERTIPVLTEKDRLKFKGIKEQMISSIIRFNKSLYTKIPAYKTVHAGEPVVLDGFAIRNVGITNLEYKAFLADLLAKNRKDEYLICEVRTGNWTKHGCPNLSVEYFQDKIYNDFPVVNISYEAAKLFCKWLEEETGTYILQNNPKLKTLHIRLPYDEEWVFAAREGYAKIAFEKGYNTIYDESVGLVNKSFTNRVELVKKHAERVDTLYSYYATNRYGWTEKEMTAFFATGLEYYSNEPADTIYASRMKVLGKFGHVSEMVPQKNNNKLWLSGLSWKSREEYQKLEQEFKTNASSPFVGFRIIVINPNDPEYKNPFW